jgi:uncharacterized membrane protein YecN with MAPEG domain
MEMINISAWTSLTIVMSLLLYLVTIVNVSRARAKYGVPVPQTTGNPDFERIMRVQQNTSEQLILFLPAFWLFSYYVNSIAGAVIGGIWLVGRSLYAWGYYQAAEKRFIGFGINSISTIVMLLGSLIGIISSLIRQ